VAVNALVVPEDRKIIEKKIEEKENLVIVMDFRSKISSIVGKINIRG